MEWVYALIAFAFLVVYFKSTGFTECKTLVCIICNSSGAKTCAFCKSICYCSLKCLEADLSLHKIICNNIASALASRPSDLYRLAFLLPEDTKAPQLIWIMWSPMLNLQPERPESHHSEIDRALMTPNVSAEFKTRELQWSDRNRELTPITRKVLRRVHLKDTIHIICRKTHRIDGSKSNACIKALLGIVREGTTHDWRGPIILSDKRGQNLVEG